jgi:hypothetical protein
MADPVCHGGGWIVGMEERLPAHPSDYYSVEGVLVGCNRVKCRRCGEWVRHFDKLRLKAITLSADDYPRLYETKDPMQFDFAYREQDSRVYVCRCAFDQTSGARALDSLDLPSWFCAGHPQS